MSYDELQSYVSESVPRLLRSAFNVFFMVMAQDDGSKRFSYRGKLINLCIFIDQEAYTIVKLSNQNN